MQHSLCLTGQPARLRLVPAAFRILLAVVTFLPVQAVQAAAPTTIYAGREKPQPREERYPYYRVLNQSNGYANNGYPGYGRPQTDVNINLRYQAPSTTIINNNVQVIPPNVPVGSISYSQDTYYINNGPVYPDDNRPHRPHRRYVNQSGQGGEPLRVVERSPWTQDLGVTPP